jgi:SAM-dependent methyltransferase
VTVTGSRPAGLRARVRRVVGTSLRAAPGPVRDVLRRGGARLATALGEPFAPGPASMPPVPPLVWVSPTPPTPEGLTLADVDACYRSWSVNGEPVGHMDAYVDDSELRFLHTWGLVRHESGRCLELGANPFFTTYLLDAHTALDLTLANYYGVTGQHTETLSYTPPGAAEPVTLDRPSSTFNVEEDVFPFEDDAFDVVLFCEMLEHLLMNPVAALREIHRVLRPGGVLVLTTPNVVRLDNALSVVAGRNIYDPYSGYGPYGRHNREYTSDELRRLLEFAGFQVETSFTADGHESTAASHAEYRDVAPLVEGRRDELGHYLFFRARASGTPREGLPSFLYRSWPEGAIVEEG